MTHFTCKIKVVTVGHPYMWQSITQWDTLIWHPVYNDNSCYTSVNFVKNLGSGGGIGSGLHHYRIEIDPTARPSARAATQFDALDGNGQLFLCLQDLAMDSFTNRLSRALDGRKRNTVLIIVSDEVSSLRNPRSTSPCLTHLFFEPLIESKEPISSKQLAVRFSSSPSFMLNSRFQPDSESETTTSACTALNCQFSGMGL